MTRDPIVDEVRKVRQEHAEKFGYDLQRIFADLKRSEEERDALKSPLLEPGGRPEAPPRDFVGRARFARR